MVESVKFLKALGIRVARGEIEEEMVWMPNHRILVLDENVTAAEILEVACDLLDVAA